nr:galactose-1-phosphate uridylyltransferase [uncultured Sulfurimonas sp.]
MSEIRLDRIHNQYILIAPERLNRLDFTKIKRLEHSNNYRCPFCETNEDLTPPEIYAIRNNTPNTSGWKTRVIPNLYKAVQIELEDKSCREGMFEYIPGVGAHEVLIDSPCHDCTMEELGATGIEFWLRSMMIRMEDLRKDKRFIHLSIFKNSGGMSGATQEHPHTQILALPVMPRDEVVFLSRNMNYYRRHGRGIVEDILQNEIFANKRIVSQVGNFVAFCPYASGFAFEVMIVPKLNFTCLEKCSRDDISDFARIIKDVFKKLTYQLGEFDYNLYFAQAPLNVNFENEPYMDSLDENYRFTLRIVPRIYNLGGFELSTNMMINPVAPEECAKLLNSNDF